MAVNQLGGMNYSFDGSVIDFFGAKGSKDGDHWTINAFGDSLWAQVSPDSMMDKVRGCLTSDIEAGNRNKVAQLQLGPRQAVVFFLEGKLTVEHLKNASEGVDFIDIPGVKVDDFTLTVRVTESPEYDVATADRDGNVI